MRLRIVFLTSAFSLLGCGAPTATAEAPASLRSTIAPILLFGGSADLCLGVSGPIAAGSRLVSVTCNDANDFGQGWVPSDTTIYPHIVLQEYPWFCLDHTNGVFTLQPCNWQDPNHVQTVTTGYSGYNRSEGAIEPFLNEQLCMSVHGAANASAQPGQPIDWEPCDQSPAETFVFADRPHLLGAESSSNEYLYDSEAFGDVISMGPADPSQAAFTFRVNGSITATAPDIGFGCLTINSANGIEGALLQVQPCLAPQPATQKWFVRQTANPASSAGARIVSAAEQRIQVNRYELECIGNDARMHACDFSANSQGWKSFP